MPHIVSLLICLRLVIVAKSVQVETQTPSFNYPRISYHRLGDAVAHPCGLQCFLYPPMDSTSIASATLWTADDTQILFTILTYAPDASSCDLAIMCRKHCREVRSVFVSVSFNS